jgi:hypothetical protein
MNRLLSLLVLSCLLLAPIGCSRRETPESSLLVQASSEQPEADDDEPAGAPPSAEGPLFARDVVPIVTKYCVACHNRAKGRGGIALDGFHDDASAGADRLLWDKVDDQLRLESMPPPGRPRPTEEELATFNTWLDAREFPSDTGKRASDRVTLRRLNRTEYNNTIRDLFGLDLRPADEFPADDIGYGFDNIGDVLSLPPLLLEKYLAASEKVVDAAFRSDAVRQRLLHPAPDDPTLLLYRAVTYPVRDEVQKRLILSATDLSPPDPAAQELERAYQILRAFADRAYRRPVTHDELTRLLRFVETTRHDGEGYEKGLRMAMRAVLVSPHFLFRVSSIGAPRQTSLADRLNDFDLATRLSYFLWGSMPDEELFRSAAQRTLRQKKTLSTQVRRMLPDPRSRSLAENFAGQWLQTRALRELTPDQGVWPDFDESLRAAMLRETELFFDSIVREDRRVLEFLDADFTFVNERLARHYGIPGVHGTEFRRVSLSGTPRAGILTQASVLTVTSNPTRTSPVKRGKWILDNILGEPPPPPPPGAGDLRDDHEGVPAGSLRQRLERHRANPDCASCHHRMDPLGFGLENFDAVGAWRDRDGASLIDATGTLPGGQPFNGPAQLRASLKARPDAFARCLVEKLLTYALGRGIERRDRRAVSEIVRKIARKDYRFSALVLAVVQSDLFQERKGEGGRQ